MMRDEVRVLALEWPDKEEVGERSMHMKKVGAVLAGAFVGLALTFTGHAGSGTAQRTVQETVALALEHHSAVRQAGLALELAELELKVAEAKGTIPSVDVRIALPSLSTGGFSGEVAGHVTLELPLSWGTTSAVSAGADFSWSPTTGEWGEALWTVSFSQSLDFAQPVAASKDLVAKRRAVDDARAALATARNAVVRQTVAAYGSLLQKQGTLGQSQSAVFQAEEALKQTQELVKAGLAAESSLVQARLTLLDAQIALSERQSSYAADKASFGRQVLGTDEDYALVSFALPEDALKEAAAALLEQTERVASAVAEASDVKAAARSVEDAREAVQGARISALPNLSFKASASQQGWELGVNVAFSLFSPTRSLDVKIAETKLAMAEDRLAAAQETEKEGLLTQQTTVRSALASLDRLPTEREKWSLEETVTKAKWEAGSLSDGDWQTFLEEKRAFLADAEQRGVTLLVAYLAYRDGLGLELDVEEWLK